MVQDVVQDVDGGGGVNERVWLHGGDESIVVEPVLVVFFFLVVCDNCDELDGRRIMCVVDPYSFRGFRVT